MPDADILSNISVIKRDGFAGCLTNLTNSDKIGLVVRSSSQCEMHESVKTKPFQFIVLCSFLSLAAVVTVIGLYLVCALSFMCICMRTC